MNSSSISGYISAILECNPLTRKSAKQHLQKTFEADLIEIIERHNTPALLAVCTTSKGLRILKVEVGRPPQKTIGEIQWYHALSGSDIKSISPNFFGGLYNDNVAVYELEFLHDYTLLEDLAIDGVVSERQIEVYVSRALDLLFDLFSSSKSKRVPFTEAETAYWLKIKQRMRAANKIPWLKTLLQQKRVVINDEELSGVPYILERLSRESVRRTFTPRHWGFIHGDLHFGNMLVKGPEVKLIDPNGMLELPIEYDVGKLLHSMHGHYNYIHRGKFSLEFDSSLRRYTFKINTQKEERDGFKNFFSLHLSNDIVLRSLFSECCHFLTMLPHHAEDQRETTALYLQTLKLFRDFFEKIKD